MINVKWYMSELHACGHVRGEIIAREVNANCCNVQIDCKLHTMFSDFAVANVMVFQRAHGQAELEKMRYAKERGIKCIYEIDDDMFSMPPEFEKPYRFYRQEEVRDRMKCFLRECDLVTVSTKYLAEQLHPICPDTPKVIVRNSIDMPMWEKPFTMRQADHGEEVTIGWMASGSHKIDAPIVAPILERLLAEHPNLKLHFIGWVGFEELGPGMAQYRDRIHVDEWIDINDLPTAMSRFDIGLAPLVDIPFNRSKSEIKALQYWALGIPIVASRSIPYEPVLHDVNGILCDNTQQDWYAALKKLIENKELRLKMGMHGRLFTLQNYDMRSTYREWVDTFEKLTRRNP